MNRSRWKHMLRESGLCIDRARLLDGIAGRPWLRVLAFRFLRLRFSPAILENALTRPVPLDERGRLYSLAMSQLNVGDTYKTTGAARTNLADAELERLAGGQDSPTVLEVGVSDGCSAAGLLGSKAFAEVLLTDRVPRFYERPIPLGRVFRKEGGRLLGIKWLCFYLNFGDGRSGSTSGYTPIETVNPVVRETFDVRSIHAFDLFRDRTDEPVALIKCSNILNSSYFPPADILRGAANLGRSLADGGHLVISHNNDKYPEGEALVVLRREGERLVLDKEMNGHDALPLFSEPLSLADEPAPKKRILFLIPSLEVGGAERQLVALAERQLVALANGLAARGHAVGVACHYPGGPLEADLAGVDLIQLRKGGRWDFAGFALRLVRAVREFAPDMVCSFLGTPNILTGLLKPLFGGAGVAWSVRASDMDLSAYDRASRFAAKLEARLSPRADVVMVNSQAGLRHALERGFPSRTMSVVPNGMDTNRFAPDRESGLPLREEWGAGPDNLLIGLVGRLDPMKDHETFLKAAALAAKQDESLRFVCVGGGPLETDLKALGASLGLENVLTWAGPRSDMPRVYNALDICALSSRTEGFPNVLGEAMACGVPCVTTDVGDARLIVGDTGLVKERENPEELAQGLLDMGARVRAGDIPDTRTRIIERFSVDRMVRDAEILLCGPID